MLDYLVVGSGLAGISFAKQLIENNKSFHVISSGKTNSSKVAGGMYNPVILKRFTPVWDIESQYEYINEYYSSLEKLLGIQVDHSQSIKRLFTSVEEQNTWFAKCDHPVLEHFLSDQLDKKKYSGVNSPFDYGTVLKGGWVDTNLLLESFNSYLSKNNLLINQSFDYSKLELHDSHVAYDGLEAKRIVFCEGIGITVNPYFNYLPMKQAKGELLIIKSPDLDIDFILKSSVFILPLGNDLFKVGATFNWKDISEDPSEGGKQELIEKLESVIDVDYRIVDQLAGIRPTVKDRRPLVGIHPKNKNLAVLNGLGTRGVLIAPKYSHQLFEHLENGALIQEEVDIKRYEKLYQ